jgi:dihydroflavonol-4-reductase
MTTCLVIGATGFIGGQIARAAAERGWQVRALRRRPGAVGAIGDVAVEWRSSDLADGASLTAAMAGCDVVFHAAGAYPHGTRRLAQEVKAAESQMRTVLDAFAAAGAGRLVYTSSFTTIGPPGEPGRLADERDPYAPGSAQEAYHEAKWAMEVAALESGLPVVALCPTAVFGPGDVHLSVSQILLLAAKGRIPVYVDAVFNIVDSRDVALAHLAAATQGRPGERYLIGGHNVTLLDGLALTARLAHAAPPRFRLSPRVLDAVIAVGQALPIRGLGHLRTMRLWQPFNNTKAVRELGLAPRPLEQTIGDALAWFKTMGYL